MSNKKKTEPLRTFNCNTIKRTIIVSKTDTSHGKFQTGVVCALRRVEHRLEKRINDLNEKCDSIIPFISINIENNLNSLESGKGIRVIAAPRNISDYSVDPEFYEESDISHLIEIEDK